MDKMSFSDILSESLVFTKKPAFLFFGFLVALPVSFRVFLLPEDGGITVEWMIDTIMRHPFTSVLFLGVSWSLSLLGKTGLITHCHAPSTPKNSKTFLPENFLERFKKSCLLDFSLFAFFLLVSVVLFLPSLFSLIRFKTVPTELSLLFLALFIPISLIFFFVREFSFLYFLLSPLSMKSALRAGSNLFLQYKIPTLLFGTHFILITLLFTFFVNLVMLETVALLQTVFGELSRPILFFVITLLAFSWYKALSQALWYVFFKNLASPKTPAQDAPLPLENEKSTSSYPLS